jgi:hypothetical protein
MSPAAMPGTEREKSLFSIKLVSKYGYHFQKLSCFDAVVRWIGCAHWGLAVLYWVYRLLVIYHVF